MFRYENPQALRYRQFYQIGVEALGTEDPRLDTEVISMLAGILKKAGLRKADFQITSIGCKSCRPGFRKVFKETIKNRLDVYEKSTAPLIDYYCKKGILKSVQGIGNIDDIFNEICSVIGS